MTASLLDDAFAHHVWATEILIDQCAALSPEQLTTPAPGTYGSILDTLRHLVATDALLTGRQEDQRRPGQVPAGEGLAAARRPGAVTPA